MSDEADQLHRGTAADGSPLYGRPVTWTFEIEVALPEYLRRAGQEHCAAELEAIGQHNWPAISKAVRWADDKGAGASARFVGSTLLSVGKAMRGSVVAVTGPYRFRPGDKPDAVLVFEVDSEVVLRRQPTDEALRTRGCVYAEFIRSALAPLTDVDGTRFGAVRYLGPKVGG
jgi:hypothetical protein